jgi:hypothetical protein
MGVPNSRASAPRTGSADIAYTSPNRGELVGLENYFDRQPDIVDPEAIVALFTMQVNCAPWPFPDPLKIEYAETLYRVIFEIISLSKLPVGQLEYTRNTGDESEPWVVISYNLPGRSFQVSFSDRRFAIACKSIRLHNLVFLARNVFGRLTEIVFSERFGAAVRLHDRTSSIGYGFSDRFRLREHKVQGQLVKNFELLAGALSLNKPPRGGAQRNVEDSFLAIGMEDFIRLDFMELAMKTIRGKRFIAGFKVEAPFNEEQSLLDMTTNLKSDQETEFALEDALNWEIPLIDFYRDIVLTRFLSNLLCSTEYDRVSAL